MQFYTKQHKFYCGIDLHTNKMYLCILNRDGDIVLHRNIRTRPNTFLRAINPFREDLVVAAECMFSWYWLADLCEDEQIPFILGHALYMRAIHGGKSKNDKIDSHKIAALLKGGLIPMAYVYPRKMRATRDKTIPGVGRIIALNLLYEIENIDRFPRVQDFASYSRLVKCAKESNGKRYGSAGKKIGNAHLRWAFSEAAQLFLKGNEPARKYMEKIVSKHGKGKALSILAHKLGRAVYFMLKNREGFDLNRFLTA
ncbi:MAG: transposase [Desulfobulbaceae bacterium]|nr:transposase [Desulfobulbaceae bacterium]